MNVVPRKFLSQHLSFHYKRLVNFEYKLKTDIGTSKASMV